MELLKIAIDIVNQSESKLSAQFKSIDNTAFNNQLKVLEAFQSNNIALRHFAGTSGYGYDDTGRDTLSKLFCDIFHTESAIVSPLIASGTHALSICLFGILRPNDCMLSISGSPYDTLSDIINGENIGSLKDFNISYHQVDMTSNNRLDISNIIKSVKLYNPKLIFVGRSRGYTWRNALSIEEIALAIAEIRKINKQSVIMVDNCYGEFMSELEPTDVGADIIAGSLIKNPGGGIAPTGGYVCGKEQYVDLIAGRLTAPSIGCEVGSFISGYTQYYQGVFMAPHVVAGAKKSAMLISQVFEDLGYKSLPKSGEMPLDIISSVEFNTKDELISFCRSVQAASPVDSNVTPYPWAMPGYEHEVIMAAGTFIQGASIEMSADSPIKEPYIAYIQGALTYEHAKIAVINIVGNIIKNKI